MNKNINTHKFPFSRFILGSIIGGSIVCGSVIFKFMQRGLDITSDIFLFSYIGTCLICVVPILIAYYKNIIKKETVYWLSFLGTSIPFGVLLWFIGLLISIFSKRRNSDIKKQNILLFSIAMFVAILLEFVFGMSIRTTYEDSFVLPKWENRLNLNKDEKNCYISATMNFGDRKSRHQMDKDYRECLQHLKMIQDKIVLEEKIRITNMSKQDQNKEIYNLCVNLLKRDVQKYSVSKYDIEAQYNLKHTVDTINKISRELCQCASNLFVEKSTQEEIVDLLFTYKPTSTNALFFISYRMPFQICIKKKYNQNQSDINRLLNISFNTF